jgi:hypothetical protein
MGEKPMRWEKEERREKERMSNEFSIIRCQSIKQANPE